MQKLMTLALAIVMLTAAFVGVASAQPYDADIYSFTRTANSMSLTGYDRWQARLQTGKWELRQQMGR